MTKSEALLKENSKYVPGGVASINRLTDPCICFAKAKGAYMWDLDGNKYIDYHAGFAPHILGFADKSQDRAVAKALDDGMALFGSGATADEGELAKLFLKGLPYADKVQFTNTGSEATAQAIRIARAETGRDHIILMQGGYNGQHNMVCANLMTDKAGLGGKQVKGDEYPLVPITAGIPKAEQKFIHAIPFNDLKAVRKVMKKYKIAALITEPVLQNIGIVKPQPGYLEGLRKLADQNGFLLIFDEVKTGFRAGIGGYQTIAKVAPDLSAFGKAFANGYPIAAIAGKQKYMDLAISDNPKKRVLIAGTYNCHPVAVAAAIACLTKLRDTKIGAFRHLEKLAKRLEKGQLELFAKYDIPVSIVRVGSAHCVYFCKTAPTNWWEVLSNHDFEFDKDYRRRLIDKGIYNFPVPCKQGSISLSHTEKDIDRTLKAIDQVLKAMTK
ncbi:MAG: aspartate aminotransferase family protein [Lentisphaeria bacterium]|nr:aspartate aminotransferase family protein [Lentisphaeria bacterium]NQZ70814.1 aspartate aminotransferase family protein [Lentisphaeria bacterium]